MKKLLPLLLATTMTATLIASCAGDGGDGDPAAPAADRPATAATTAPASTVAALASCADLPSLPTAVCGTVTVPLDRSDPGSASTRVAFALVPRTDTTRPGLGTIVPNPGGPGTSAIDATGALFTEALQPLVDRRDVLLIDPRGVGRSDAITCAALEGPDDTFGTLAQQRAAIGACGEQLGDRVGDYGTNAVADDVDAVRASLGIDDLDLLGLSYGTYLMPVYAQRHPEHVRTLSLAGAYSVNDDPTGAVGAAAFRRAVELTCENLGSCSGDVVLADLASLATQLRTHPESVDVPFEGAAHHVVLDEWRLASVAGRVFSSVPDPEGLQALAGAAASARTGDLAPLREFVTASLTATAEIASSGAEVVSVAQSWATTCHDYLRSFDYSDSPAEREQTYDATQADLQEEEFAPFSASAWTTRADYDNGACLAWPDDPTAEVPFARGTELPDVPVLVLNGDLDANTPSASGRQAAAQFPDATFVEVPGAGHTPATTPEGLTRILSFIAAGHV
ncbi:alpha/beta hydrolase [Kineococcus rubinsiae]|uniref:alpha/beta hydrolase n=1 Tax=Kineococcus rubinsiae TaxID=2609562 RepID=UPI00142FDAB5|nr:alpha/beta fold hydrolase [Kineococcus rubinsiae]NIZ91373.1 alpha/beta hydrolase [Kineococcus rubinsiae]